MLSPLLDVLLLIVVPLLSALSGYLAMRWWAGQRDAASQAPSRSSVRSPSAAQPSGSTAVRASAQPRPAVASGDDERPKPERVLLVDDSAVARAKLRKLFEQAGFEVHLATDGLEALALLDKGRYALMVTDLEMPNMDGVALVNRCMHHPLAAGMPILAVSGHDGLRARFDQCQGVAGVHRKPWVDDILLSHAATLVGARQPRRRAPASVPVAAQAAAVNQGRPEPAHQPRRSAQPLSMP